MDQAAADKQVKRKYGRSISLDDELDDISSSFKRIRTSEKGNSTADAASSQHSMPPEDLPKNGSEWVELFVRNIRSAPTMDDAKSSTSKLLEVLQKSILSHAMEAAGNTQQEYAMLKQQSETLTRKNDGIAQEMDQLKHLLIEKQEELRKVEFNNYALRLHLQEAKKTNSSSGRCYHYDLY
ncbi:hypothetical protein MKX01_012915 [Papaver californicum]|nr:hypothetical protein MKX01_012915 [Papaver californicum]